MGWVCILYPGCQSPCSQDSRSFHQRIEISEILTELHSLCPGWLMKADKSDEKIPTQTIPSEAYFLSDISAFMGCRAHTKTCKICLYWPQMKPMMVHVFCLRLRHPLSRCYCDPGIEGAEGDPDQKWCRHTLTLTYMLCTFCIYQNSDYLYGRLKEIAEV